VLDADVAWSQRRVNGRTSEESLDAGCAQPQAACHSRHPCDLRCPAVAMHWSGVSYVSIRHSETEDLWEVCVPGSLSELYEQGQDVGERSKAAMPSAFPLSSHS
jgi:hypothetical protein